MEDLEIVFADGQKKTFEVPNGAVISDIIHSFVNNLGLNDNEANQFKSDWGLAIYNQHRHCWIDLEWLDPMQNISALAHGTRLVFGRRYFSTSDDLQLLMASPFLRQILYHQLLQSYLSGFIHCTATKAAKLSALAAYARVASSDYLTSGTRWLEEVIPPRLKNTPFASKSVSKHMQGIGNRSELIVQTAFIKGINCLDTSGYSLYTAQMEGVDGVIGIKDSNIVWMDDNTMEPILEWSVSDTTSYEITPDELLHLTFNDGTQVQLKIKMLHQLTLQLDRVQIANQTPDTAPVAMTKPFNSYVLNTGEGEEEGREEHEVIKVKQEHVLSREISNEEEEVKCVNKPSKNRKSPISRQAERRKAFRLKSRNQLTESSKKTVGNYESVEELSALMSTDFTTDAKWTNRDSNPIYDSIAGTRAGMTLKRSKVTFSSLAVTMTTPPPTPSRPLPPLVPPKPNMSMAQQEDTGAPPEYSQRLGAYPLELTHPVEGEINDNRSKPVLPGEVLKDYSTLKREFRMFCVKLPNGRVHWELASLYQPIKKLIARLCVIIHIDDADKYQLSVEGSVFCCSKRNYFRSEQSEDTSSSREFTPSPLGRRRKLIMSTSTCSVIGTNVIQDTPVVLDSSFTFNEQGITTSKILSLSSIDHAVSPVNTTPIRLPGWVKFRQCWLSVVHGNHPCSLQEAITLAAILYQCYVLDRTEVNSVISFCNVVDFLPPQYAHLRGIENKVLQERETLLCYSRSELEQFYIEGVSSSPVYSYAFFSCKEPRKQFLSNSKMFPVLIGIGREGVVRMNYRTKEVMDTWGYDILKNWGCTQQSFMLAFDSSTYPVKCTQGKWMAELVSYHVQSIVKEKGLLQDEQTILPSPVATPTTTPTAQHAYFALEARNEPETEPVEPTPQPAVRESTYFTLEKVYDDLVETRNINKKKQELTDSSTAVYVNPHPNCSLINPNPGMMARLQKFGITSTEEHFYDEVAFEDEEEVLYDQVPDDEDLTEDDINISDGEKCYNGGSLSSSDEQDYDEAAYYHTVTHSARYRVKNSFVATAPGHIYDIPPDAH